MICPGQRVGQPINTGRNRSRELSYALLQDSLRRRKTFHSENPVISPNNTASFTAVELVKIVQLKKNGLLDRIEKKTMMVIIISKNMKMNSGPLFWERM